MKNIENSKTFRGTVRLVFALIIASVVLLSITSLFASGSLHAAEANKTASDISKSPQEQKETLPAATPRVLMRDSQTGYAVLPDEIIIIETNTNKTVYHKKYAREEAIKEFKGVFPTMPDLPPGSYQFIIQAKGYKSITSHFDTRYERSKPAQKVQPEEHPLESITFFLTPVETPPELKHEALKSLSRWDSAVLVGFVVDDETGLPIADATVSTEDRKISAKTNERGFFVIRFPLPPGYAGSVESPVLINIIYEKIGYRSEEIERYELMPTDVGHAPIWLKPGKGKRIVDSRTKIERIEP